MQFLGFLKIWTSAVLSLDSSIVFHNMLMTCLHMVFTPNVSRFVTYSKYDRCLPPAMANCTTFISDIDPKIVKLCSYMYHSSLPSFYINYCLWWPSFCCGSYSMIYIYYLQVYSCRSQLSVLNAIIIWARFQSKISDGNY